MDYSKTLNLPQTEFPMRGNLPQREPEILKQWQEMDLYNKVQEKNQGKTKYILHDGPPYANGHIHLGHTLNKVLKDMIVKYRSMSGYDSPYIPGWDTHGLPIEQQAIKQLGINRHQIDPVEFRKKCKDYALEFVNIQSEEFQRLGVRGDWARPYITLLPQYEATQIRVFGEMAKKGYIYKGLKPVYWCASCETALAEAEVEYADKTSPSIYVKFAVKDGKGVLPEDAALVIWTTTPWTLPANVAISVHPEFEYVLALVKGQKVVVAKELLAAFKKVMETEEAEILATYKGEQLDRVVCHHPFVERDSLIILGDHVTLEAGTGAVHTAPGHGEDDFIVGKKYNLPVLAPIDNKGKFTAEGGKFAGQFILDANKTIIDELKEREALMGHAQIKHQYPHCWRCKQPIIFRATEQWFASVEGFRQDALNAIRNVKWVPEWGQNRIYNMVEGRGDWCVSRQRTWGVPIPIFYCNDCGKEIITEETIAHIQKLFKEYGSDIWFAKDANELVPPGLTCPCCGKGKDFRKETDIMDVWFDSGSSHLAVLDQPELWPELQWPADLYLEGSDQHRGWFNSSLSTSVAVTGKPPYKAVLTHGFLVDEKGRKMSKSLGNVVDPLKVINQMGADILRLWVSSADYRSDLSVSPNIIKQMTESYRKIRNTARFLLGNLYDFDPAKDKVTYEKLPELDRVALLELHKLIKRVLSAYENYEFHVVYHAVHNYCVVDLSAFYLDIIKDRLYTAPPASLERRAAQTVLYEALDALVRLLTPVLAFTTEEIYKHMPVVGERLASVQLLDMPEVNEEYLDVELEKKWDKFQEIRKEVLKSLELARQNKVIGNALEAKVDLYVAGEVADLLQPMADELTTLFIVSTVNLQQLKAAPAEAVRAEELELAVLVTPAEGDKCERCWMYHEAVGQDTEHTTLCPRCAGVVKEHHSY
ncbi:isoleucine--tRNA ligase [Desulforamulus aeronauticus]|uniref:Isoleucine--tRNA ligase n=1 Tax=Desulforamulus aeronauticus DSM 10349 TaxID=1121421 RepID=A0A1M6PP40_9FIRM|nr:isoleucine--tRNA ligase [Desulforamulus aeronauticus]SHK09608.1 Isoleucyl-tRNA synthetase [Desulforamulus aeronauticus DSM 10349]